MKTFQEGDGFSGVSLFGANYPQSICCCELALVFFHCPSQSPAEEIARVGIRLRSSDALEGAQLHGLKMEGWVIGGGSVRGEGRSGSLKYGRL